VVVELGLQACTEERAGAALTEMTAVREEGEVVAAALTERTAAGFSAAGMDSLPAWLRSTCKCP
jgi:hypothetical protein